MSETVRRKCQITSGCLIAFLLGISADAAGQTRPTPLVRSIVEINSPLLSNNLNGADVNRVKQELAAYTAEKLPTPGFEFVQWAAQGTNGDTSPTAEFHVVIEENSGSGIPRLMLEYQVSVKGKPVALSSMFSAREIYDGPAPSVHSASRLIADIKAFRLDKDLANEEFRKRLGEEFVRNIPLSEKVIVEEGKTDIIVPLDFEGLHASDQSHLYVAFTAQPDSQPPETGVMRLRPIKRVSDGAFQGGVDCRVYMFEFRDVSVPEPGGNDPRVVLILAAPSVKSAQIFMEKFERRTGDLFTSPNP